MKKQKGFDAAKYEPMLNELVQLEQKGFSGIYKGDEQALANARKALGNKKAILLGNPLLDADKIVAVRYKLGSTARQAMAPDLGTQANNWSNQESARRSGFNAEIVELSDLRGNMQMKSIFRPYRRPENALGCRPCNVYDIDAGQTLECIRSETGRNRLQAVG